MSSKSVSGRLRKRFWKEVKEEFPHDYALQTVHFARRLIDTDIRGLTPEEIVEYFRKAGERFRSRSRRSH